MGSGSSIETATYDATKFQQSKAIMDSTADDAEKFRKLKQIWTAEQEAAATKAGASTPAAIGGADEHNKSSTKHLHAMSEPPNETTTDDAKPIAHKDEHAVASINKDEHAAADAKLDEHKPSDVADHKEAVSAASSLDAHAAEPSAHATHDAHAHGETKHDEHASHAHSDAKLDGLATHGANVHDEAKSVEHATAVEAPKATAKHSEEHEPEAVVVAAAAGHH